MSDRAQRRKRHRKSKARVSAKKLAEAFQGHIDHKQQLAMKLRVAEEHLRVLRFVMDNADRVLGGRVLTVLGYRKDPEPSQLGERHTFTARRYRWSPLRGLCDAPPECKDMDISMIVSEMERRHLDGDRLVQRMLDDAGSKLGVELTRELRQRL